MPWEAWYTLAIVVVMIVGLARNWAPTDLLMLGCLTLLVIAKVLSGSALLPNAAEAVTGFGNEGLLTVAVMFVVVAGLMQTGAMTMLAEPLLGRPKSVFDAQVRIMFPVATASAFLNNTPVVAMFMPVVDEFCKKHGISPSKLFLPLSYAAIFGGICTLIGTSTNLVVNGFLVRDNYPSMRMFDLAWVGVPCSLVGIAYLIAFGRWLLPDRKPAISLSDDPRQYTVEMIVEAGGPLVGRTIEQAGLRHLPGLYLAEIDRKGEILPAVAPKTRLEAEDRLVFAGILESVVDLRRIRGLSPATNQTFKLDAPPTQRCLIEAVVSDRCPLIGKTIREGRFRTVYNAAVLALARSGKRIAGKLGDIELRPGDTLLLEAHGDFVSTQRNSSDFFLVSRVENSSPPRHEKAPIALAILIALVLFVGLEWVDMLAAGMIALCLMVFTRCCTGTEARQAIDWQVLITIGAALGIGAAIRQSTLAETVSSYLIGLAGGNRWMVLAMVYFVTLIFTELLTNNAAAALVYPIAIESAKSLGASYLPFVIAIMVAASSGFATPFGYQTHLMVYGPGGYRFSDFLRIGIPLDILFMIVTVAITPYFFPF